LAIRCCRDPDTSPRTPLAAIVGRLPGVEVGTAVPLPALHNPVLLAREDAALDQVAEAADRNARDVANIPAEIPRMWIGVSPQGADEPFDGGLPNADDALHGGSNGRRSGRSRARLAATPTAKAAVHQTQTFSVGKAQQRPPSAAARP